MHTGRSTYGNLSGLCANRTAPVVVRGSTGSTTRGIHPQHLAEPPAGTLDVNATALHGQSSGLFRRVVQRLLVHHCEAVGARLGAPQEDAANLQSTEPVDGRAPGERQSRLSTPLVSHTSGSVPVPGSGANSGRAIGRALTSPSRLSMSSPTPAYSLSNRSGRRKQSVTRTVVQAPSPLSDQQW